MAVVLPARAGEDRVRLDIIVTAEPSGKPIKNAAVYIKFKQKRLLWKDKKVEWTVKTNPDGHAIVPSLPRGTVLIQVVAKGWKTYGEFHELEELKQRVEVKLKRPKKWY